MINSNVKTLLLLTTSGPNSIFPFLFELAKCIATQGRQLLYISRSRIECLPPTLEGIPNPHPHILKLMQFMYLPKWTDLLYQLATIHIRRFRVCAIVIDNIVDYFKDEEYESHYIDHISYVCASLIFATSVSSAAYAEPVVLVCGYVSDEPTIEHNIIKNFFHNIWEVKVNKECLGKTLIKVSKKTMIENNDIISFMYCDNHDLQYDKDRSKTTLKLTEIIKKMIYE